MSFQQAPQGAGTVPVHVQVIDMQPFALDLVVPTYISAIDLTQRVARDAGLGAYWDDGTRRNFYLRARGRVLQEHEKLEELGVVPYELLHLLPEPPKDSGIEERPPDYPPNRGYAGAGNLNVVSGLGTVLAFAAAWGVALTVSQSPAVSLFPAVGLALLCTSLGRHLWGGLGSSVKVPLTGVLFYFPLMILACLPMLLAGGTPLNAGMAIGPGIIGGLFGVTLGWLAWYGAVEPLPKVTAREIKDAAAAAVYQCAICGGAVTQDQLAQCTYKCGRVFHTGCYRAKQSLGDGQSCAVCGYRPAAA